MYYQESQLSPGDKEQAIDSWLEVIITTFVCTDSLGSMTELRSEVKRRLLEYEKLQEELDQLTDEYDEQADKIHQLEKGEGLAYNYNEI